MNSGTMQDFLKGNTILVTGTTGFLAKGTLPRIISQVSKYHFKYHISSLNSSLCSFFGKDIVTNIEA